MSVSLHIKLKEIHRFGGIELRRDPTRHYFEGEGSYFYNNEPLQFETNVWTPGPHQRELAEVLRASEISFNQPHDLAWCPQQKMLVAYAHSTTEEFSMPDSHATETAAAV